MSPARARGRLLGALCMLAVLPFVAAAGGTAAEARGTPAVWEPQTPPPSDTIRVATTPLERAALEFASAWRGEAGGRAGGLMAEQGIRLQLQGSAHTGLSGRQAAASVRDFLRGFESGEAVVLRAVPVEGSADRGFAEVQWTAVVAGTSHRVDRTLYLGLVREGESRWVVNEVRLLR